MALLKIHFRGICVHFRHLVPAIPHRVVLPNATALRFGLVDMPGASRTLPYVLAPHFPMLLVRNDEMQLDLNVGGVMTGGIIYDAVRLQVANAIRPGVIYSPDYHEVAQVARYVEAYQFSDEVVLGGRASCYFDVTSGYIAPDRVGENIAGVVVTIETAGPPMLAASPFFQATAERPAVSFITLPGDDVELVVGNVGLGCGEGGADGFDFLLNYLTLKGGLPRHLCAQPPQVVPVPFGDAIATAIARLAEFHWPDGVHLPDFDTMLFSPTLSCSNSTYP